MFSVSGLVKSTALVPTNLRELGYNGVGSEALCFWSKAADAALDLKQGAKRSRGGGEERGSSGEA
jgi:hypothetical protein